MPLARARPCHGRPPFAGNLPVDTQGFTPLLLAAASKQPAAVERLLEKAADFKAEDEVHGYAAATTIIYPLPADCVCTFNAAPHHLEPFS
jgi:hypothetical protein